MYNSQETPSKLEIVERERINKFLGGFLKPSVDNFQAKGRSFCDRQMDVIVTYLGSLIRRSQNSENVVLDYGCGKTGNLFFVLYQYLENEIIRKISYYGIDIHDSFDKISFDNFDDIITHFGNSNKDLEAVFMNIENYRERIITDQTCRADYLIVKNVMHEITLLEIPVFLKDVSVLLNSG